MTVDINGTSVLSLTEAVELAKELTKLGAKTNAFGNAVLSEDYDVKQMKAEMQLVLDKSDSDLAKEDAQAVLDALKLARASWPESHATLEKVETFWAPKIKAAIPVKQLQAKKSFATGPLEEAVKGLYRDAYFAGWKLGGQDVQKLKRADDPGVLAAANASVMDFSWDDWQPGNEAAASLLADEPGLKGLLDDAGIAVKSIRDNMMSDVADTLAYAAEQGQSVASIADAISELVEARAWMIATTELARAVGIATDSVYDFNDIKQYNWITGAGACDECVDKEQNGPYQVGRDQLPPLHPICRCATTPVPITPGSK